MPLRELRTAAGLQVVIGCALIGVVWGDLPADAAPRLMPRVVFGWVLVALIAPLMPGTWDHGDWHPGVVLLQGLLLALPLALLARAMADTPHATMALTARVAAWAWAAWFVSACAYWAGWGRRREAARRPRGPAAPPPGAAGTPDGGR